MVTTVTEDQVDVPVAAQFVAGRQVASVNTLADKSAQAYGAPT